MSEARGQAKRESTGSALAVLMTATAKELELSVSRVSGLIAAAQAAGGGLEQESDLATD